MTRMVILRQVQARHPFFPTDCIVVNFDIGERVERKISPQMRQLPCTGLDRDYVPLHPDTLPQATGSLMLTLLFTRMDI